MSLLCSLLPPPSSVEFSGNHGPMTLLFRSEVGASSVLFPCFGLGPVEDDSDRPIDGLADIPRDIPASQPRHANQFAFCHRMRCFEVFFIPLFDASYRPVRHATGSRES